MANGGIIDSFVAVFTVAWSALNTGFETLPNASRLVLRQRLAGSSKVYWTYQGHFAGVIEYDSNSQSFRLVLTLKHYYLVANDNEVPWTGGFLQAQGYYDRIMKGLNDLSWWESALTVDEVEGTTVDRLERVGDIMVLETTTPLVIPRV